MAKKAAPAKKPAKQPAPDLDEPLLRRRAARLYVEGASVESIAAELGTVPAKVRSLTTSPKVKRMRKARAARAATA